MKLHLLFLMAVLLSSPCLDAKGAREVRGAARTSVHEHGGGHRQLNADVNRNVNVNRNIDVNHHVDVDVDVDRNYHPWATAAAVTTAAVVTGAVIGSIVRSVPPSCQTVIVNGISYSQCGSTWYMPQMQGASVAYVVVAPPR
jgi:hypothetical protein